MAQYSDFEQRLREISNLTDIEEVLHWDQQVMMPEEGIKARSEQISVVSRLQHEKLIDERLGEIISELEKEESDQETKANLREIKREHQRAKDIPEELIQKISQKQSETISKWEKAREENNFELFAPHLEEIVELKREYAEHIDSEKEPYKVLFEDYEPYIQFETMEKILNRLKENLIDLISEIRESDSDLSTDIFYGDFDEQKQVELNQEILEDMKYDRKRGRLDTSTHPFTAGNQFDCRITTRYDEEDMSESILPTIHECGHALYELGLPREKHGVPVGQSRDLSVHESQSRLWENHVGRSKAFSRYLLPKLKDKFPEEFENVSAQDCFESLSQVHEENPIRVQADELTYHLHIVLRFELGRKLINGDIEVEELPELWNDKMEEYLGFRPETDVEGVLQDIHWSQGSFGYFPTYSLGSVIAAQLYSSAEQDIDNLEQKIEEGNFENLLEWLRENIHSKGKLYKTEQLIEKATGEKPKADYFLHYIEEKYSELYAL